MAVDKGVCTALVNTMGVAVPLPLLSRAGYSRVITEQGTASKEHPQALVAPDRAPPLGWWCHHHFYLNKGALGLGHYP